MEKLIKAGHLRSYVRETDHGVESRQAANRITTDVTIPSKSRLAINSILGGPFDDQYQSKRQQKKLLRAATVKARVNATYTEGEHEETKLIDGPISFPSVNQNRVIVPYYDALVLTLCSNGFDVHRVLVDLNSMTDLLQLSTFKQMKLSLSVLKSTGQVLSGFNGATSVTLGDVTLLVKAGPVSQQVLFPIVKDLGPYNTIMGLAWLLLMKVIPSTYH